LIRKRGRYYHFEIWLGGERKAYGSFNGKDGLPLAKDKREARDFEGQIRRQVIDGTWRQGEDRDSLKDFATFVDKVYLPYAHANHAEPAHDEFRSQTLKEYFSGKRLNEITTMLVEKYINDRLATTTVRKTTLPGGERVNKRRSPTTVRKEVVLLSSIFNMAKQERLVTENPCDFIRKSVRKKVPARVKRNRYLTLEEERLLFEELTGRREHIAPAARLALLTGMRRGEILSLRWEHVNLTGRVQTFVVKGETWEVRPGWLLIERSKNGRPRAIPMSGRVRDMMAGLYDDESRGEFVFQNERTGLSINDIKTGFTGACREADILNLTFHDLRHTWSTRAAECGVPESVRRDILGHSSPTMTGDYTHTSPEAMEKAMELVADYSREKIFSLTAKSRQAG
jgi:integrase